MIKTWRRCLHQSSPLELWHRNELLKYQMCISLAKRAVTYLDHLPQPAQRAWGAKGRQQVTLQSALPSFTKAVKLPFPVWSPIRGCGRGGRYGEGGSQQPPPPPHVPSPCRHILQFLQLLQHGLGQQPALLWGRERGVRRARTRPAHTAGARPAPRGGSAVPSAPRTAPGAAAASPSAAPGACGKAGATVSIPWRERGDYGRGKRG